MWKIDDAVDKIDNSEYHIVVLFGYLRRVISKNIFINCKQRSVKSIKTFEHKDYLIMAIDKKFNFTDLCVVITRLWCHIVLDDSLNILIDTDGVAEKGADGVRLETLIEGADDFKNFLMYKDK